MLNFAKPSIFFISILILTLQGCGGGDSSSTYQTTLSTSISVHSAEESAVMAPNSNTMKDISVKISSILKTDITAFNKKVIVEFDKETNYCDISGLRESQNSGTLKKVTSTKNYENCQEEKTLEHGKVNIDYSRMDTEGKYPKALYLTVKEAYRFNHIELKKDLTVESSITYNADKSINQIILKINGKLTLDGIDYGLLNLTQTVTY
jgi:hypothetical protein